MCQRKEVFSVAGMGEVREGWRTQTLARQRLAVVGNSGESLHSIIPAIRPNPQLRAHQLVDAADGQGARALSLPPGHSLEGAE